MRWKHKYIVGVTTMSMLFALPLSSAAEDDVVVFGGQYEDNNKPVAVENTVEAPPAPAPVEEPQRQTENVEQPNSEVVEPENTPNEPVATNVAQDNLPSENTIQVDIPEPQIEITTPPVEVQTPPVEVQPPQVEIQTQQVEVQVPVTKIEVEVPVENMDSSNPTNPPADEPTIEVTPVEPVIEVTPVDPIIEITEAPKTSSQPEIQYPEPQPQIVIEQKKPQSSSPNDGRRYIPKTQSTSQTGSTKQKARFVKILSDDIYDYYLDRKAVRWINMPYSTSEYMADVWIRMLEKRPNMDDVPEDMYDYVQSVNDEISDAAAKGVFYDDVDVKVLRTKKYFLEHYYIRPKTQQIQFLCELEVIGRPQNAISERAYEYRNWENLIPGSVESSIYYGVLSTIGKGKASSRGHMTFVDMLDEYVRIALN